MLYSKKLKRVYNPQITLDSYLMLKRLSWLTGKPMTKTLDSIIYQVFKDLNPKVICKSCKAPKKECKGCIIEVCN